MRLSRFGCPVTATRFPAFFRPPGMLKEARSVVATEVQQDIADLATNISELVDVLDAIIESGDVGPKDRPRTLIGLHFERHGAVHLDTNE